MVSIIISIATDYWLFVMEKLPLEYFMEYNTVEYDYIEEWMPNATLSEQIEVNAFMGLWRFCTTAEGYQFCEHLDYKTPKVPREEVSLAIAESQRESTPLFLTALVVIIGSGVFNIAGNIRWTAFTITAGVCYIMAALFIAVGMIIYIANVDTEVTAENKIENMDVTYTYGWSAYVMGLCFISSIAAAIVCIIIFCKEWKQNRHVPEIKIQFMPLEETTIENEISIV